MKSWPFATMWMELECIILSEVSQSGEDIYNMITHVEFKIQNVNIKEGKKN